MFDFSCNEEASHLIDWDIPVAFNHRRNLEKIVGIVPNSQKWRVKDRMKTVSVALVLCLNVGVDPPDVIKTQPCARLECWMDPLSMVGSKALECIAGSLQKQYEKWQPRARYKHALDPTVEEVKRLCISMRRGAKDERVLFHYNGHGVPKPTANGEIWVFNKTYTQYIPLSLYDLQQWLGAPSIYVYDCSCAGLILESFKNFATQHEREFELAVGAGGYEGPPLPAYSQCIQLGACKAEELLPMHPDIPADLFTSCLTTPVLMALKWFVLQNGKKLLPGITLDLIDQLPGQVADRRTLLGELNWIFTAITDTIAWDVLPRDLFQRLFRQDLMVASLFRNFILAQRIMRYYNCTPVSHPQLPDTHHHPMWQAWDLAVDACLSQLPGLLAGKAAYVCSPFFSEQLTAFQVWLSLHYHTLPGEPQQLPIVLQVRLITQVLLSQIHRLRALELLGRFLDLGPWAVNLALSVGIFPYVLKLLQSSARELRPLLVFIWAKVLAVDYTCQADLVRDGSFKYFLAVLEPFMPAEHKTMAAFCVSCIVNNYRPGQASALQSSVVSVCLEQLNDPCGGLRQWAAMCLGRVWAHYEPARWCGIRDSAHEKLQELLSDPQPEVRAAAVFALGSLVSSSKKDRSDHDDAIDHSIAMMLLHRAQNDGSPLVRAELLGALQWFLILFENLFVAVGQKHIIDEERIKEGLMLTPETPTSLRKVSSRDLLKASLSGSPGSIGFLSDSGEERLRRVSSSTSISSLGSNTLGYTSLFDSIWKCVVSLTLDPHPHVAGLACTLMNHILNKVTEVHYLEKISSEPPSSSPRPFTLGEGSPSANRWTDSNAPYQQYQYFAQFNRIRKTFDKGPEVNGEGVEVIEQEPREPLIDTQFAAWCTTHFSQPLLKTGEGDPDSQHHLKQEWFFLRNEATRNQLVDEREKIENGFHVEEQVFINKNNALPTSLRFHPFQPQLMVADKEGFSVWDWEKGLLIRTDSTPGCARITALDFLNAHVETMLMLGSDDGVIKIYKNYVSDSDIQLVTAFKVIQDLLPSTRGSGLVLEWEQHTRHLLASGDVRHIRVWDTETETKIQDLPSRADSCVTCLSSNVECPGMVAAGCGDGTVRLYDRRRPANEGCVHMFQDHSGWVVDVQLNSKHLISGSVAGDVRLWDVRGGGCTRTFPPAQGMTAMDVHPNLPLIACGTAGQVISVVGTAGESLGTVKYHDGFLGQRIGPVSCLAFHPYKASLAAGCTDSLISVYSARRH